MIACRSRPSPLDRCEGLADDGKRLWRGPFIGGKKLIVGCGSHLGTRWRMTGSASGVHRWFWGLIFSNLGLPIASRRSLADDGKRAQTRRVARWTSPNNLKNNPLYLGSCHGEWLAGEQLLEGFRMTGSAHRLTESRNGHRVNKKIHYT